VIEKRNREIKTGAVEALSRPAGRGLGLIAGLEGRRIGINVLRRGRIIGLQQPPGERLEIINYAELSGRELVAKPDLPVRLTRAICETQETGPDLAVAMIGPRA
jgi:hypothetical protein